ncbi:hypothetical protein RQP46_003191 [Phenoliferia psychrophenolica]
MAAVQSTPLPGPLDPLSPSFAATSVAAPYLSGTTPPIVDPEAIKKAIFETSYEPSEKLWADNQAAYVKPDHDPLPDGFPAKAVGTHVWEGAELAKTPERWLHVFTAAEVEEVQAAVDHFLSLRLPFSAVSQETFPLSTLEAVLHQAVLEIHQGLGFRLLRGLPVDKWDRKSQIIAYAGISSYIGSERFRQPGATAIHHLRDITKMDASLRPAIVVKGQTSGNQVFHTDQGGDILGLFVLDRAETGGLSQLASVGATYNALAESRRDILRTLADPKWKSRYETEPRALIDLIHNVDGRVVAAYSRRPYFPFFEDQSNAEGLPALTPAQHLALDALHFTAEAHSLSISIEPGDLSYFNDFLLFHARTASEDSPDHTRHLLRIYLRNEEYALDHGRALDKRLESLKGSEADTWPLEAWTKVAA